jgi:hypothetical protein
VAWQTRQAQTEVRRITSATRIYNLIVSYAEWLEKTFLERVSSASEAGLGFMCIDSAFLPNKYRKQAPNTTHWAGQDQDPSSGGVPKVMLLLGKRVSGSNESDPALLPGGKTSLGFLGERLYPKGYQVCVLYDDRSRSYKVYVVWDQDAWSDWYRRNLAWKTRTLAAKS